MLATNDVYSNSARGYYSALNNNPDFLLSKMQRLEPEMDLVRQFINSGTMSTSTLSSGSSILTAGGRQLLFRDARNMHKVSKAFLATSKGSLIFETGESFMTGFIPWDTAAEITAETKSYPHKAPTVQFVMNWGNSYALFDTINTARVGEMSVGVNNLLADPVERYYNLSYNILNLAKEQIVVNAYNSVEVTYTNNDPTISLGFKDFKEFSIYGDLPDSSPTQFKYERIKDKRKDLTAAFPTNVDFQEIKNDFVRKGSPFASNAPMLVMLPDHIYQKFVANEVKINPNIFDTYREKQRDKTYKSCLLEYSDHDIVRYLSFPAEYFKLDNDGNYICPIVSKYYYDVMLLPKVVNIPELSYSPISHQMGNYSGGSYQVTELAGGMFYIAAEYRESFTGKTEPSILSNYFVNVLPVKANHRGFAFATIKPTYS